MKLARRTVMIAAVLAVLLAIAAGSTAYGYFFSGKVIENNQVKTGELRLQLNDGGAVIPINLDNGVNDIMPGDSGTVGDYKISNIGNIHSSLYVGITPHGDWDANLGDVLLVAVWLDKTGNGVWDDGDAYFVPNGPFVSWQTGDPLAVPAAAYKPFNDFRGSLANTLNVDGHGVAGWLKFSYCLPADVVDTPEKPLMGKECNFDLLVQLDQYHPLQHKAYGASTLNGATITAYCDGVAVPALVTPPLGHPGCDVVAGNHFEIWLPANQAGKTYTLVYTLNGVAAFTKSGVDLSTQDVTFDTT